VFVSLHSWIRETIVGLSGTVREIGQAIGSITFRVLFMIVGAKVVKFVAKSLADLKRAVTNSSWYRNATATGGTTVPELVKGKPPGNATQWHHSTPPRHANRGSTGRTIPRSSTEQTFMDMVRRDPMNGATQTPLNLSDPRWLGSEGWVKMQTVARSDSGNITIHFNWNPILNLVDDFKFVYPQ